MNQLQSDNVIEGYRNATDAQQKIIAELREQMRHMIRIDDPVVTRLVDCAERIHVAGREHGSDALTGEPCDCERCENYFAIFRALSAYEARVKEVGK